MVATSYAINERSSTSGSPNSGHDWFPPLEDLWDNSSKDHVGSSERYRDSLEIGTDDFLEGNILKLVVPRTLSIHDHRRTTPTSTGKLVEWEGVVEALENDQIHCKLRVIKGSDADFDEFTTFDIERVTEGDRDLVKPGALFRLVIGVQAISGRRQQFSQLVFRRLPAWNMQSIEQAQKRLEGIFQGINWADESSS